MFYEVMQGNPTSYNIYFEPVMLLINEKAIYLLVFLSSTHQQVKYVLEALKPIDS